MAENQVAINLSAELTDKLNSVSEALPMNFNKTRFVQNCLAILNDKPELRKFGANAIIKGCMKAAYVGCDFMLGEAYLIPYGNELQFQLSYRGDIKFTKANATRPIKDIYAKVVRQGDDFEEKIVDGNPSIDFKPLPFNDGDIVGAFAVVKFDDGGMLYEAMSVKDIQNVRNNYSKVKGSGAWTKSFDEMCKKVVLRRLCKHIDKNVDSVEALKAFDEGGGMTFEKPVPGDIVTNPFDKEEKEEENVIDVEAVEVEEVAAVDGSLDEQLPFK